MASTKRQISEQILRRLSAGNPSVASKVHQLEVDKAVEQVLNGMLRVQHLEQLQLDETIPAGGMLAFYENIPVTSYNGVSRCTLPVIPVTLIKGLGVFSIRPHVDDSAPVQLGTPTLTATAISDTQINLSSSIVTGATTYVFQQKINDVWTVIQSGLGRSKSVTGLTALTTYEFRVKAMASGFVDSGFSEASATTQATVVVTPLSVQNVTATPDMNTLGKISISWDGNADTYTIYVFEDAGTFSISLPSIGSKTGVTGTSDVIEDLPLAIGDRCWVWVVGFKSGVNTISDTSSSVRVAPAPDPNVREFRIGSSGFDMEIGTMNYTGTGPYSGGYEFVIRETITLSANTNYQISVPIGTYVRATSTHALDFYSSNDTQVIGYNMNANNPTGLPAPTGWAYCLVA